MQETLNTLSDRLDSIDAGRAHDQNKVHRTKSCDWRVPTASGVQRHESTMHNMEEVDFTEEENALREEPEVEEPAIMVAESVL